MDARLAQKKNSGFPFYPFDVSTLIENPAFQRFKPSKIIRVGGLSTIRTAVEANNPDWQDRDWSFPRTIAMARNKHATCSNVRAMPNACRIKTRGIRVHQRFITNIRVEVDTRFES
jgi:hypothetical protein